jgi:hypothetical protein
LRIGGAEWSEGKTIDELLDDADREMYAAKADHPLNKGNPNLAKAAEQTVGL